MRALAMFFAAAAIANAPSRAQACSPPPCWPGYFSPADGATVPANLPAIHWHPMRDGVGTIAPDPTKVVLATQAAPNTPIALTATALPGGDFILVPAMPLAAGEMYTLTDHTVCSYPGTSAPHGTFHTGAVAPLPTQLGTLTTSSTVGSMTVGTSSGSCSTEVTAASAEVALGSTQDALPWGDALLYQTLVDGAPWGAQRAINVAIAPGTSWEGRGVDRVYHLCQATDPGAANGVAAGTHQVVMQATLPGSSLALSTAPITIDLECGGGGGDAGDGGNGGHSAAGCSATGSPSALLLVLGALALRRRQRNSLASTARSMH